MGRTTVSERVAAEAFEKYGNGDIRGCLHMLVDYADRRVNNERTAQVFKNAIDCELDGMDGSDLSERPGS